MSATAVRILIGIPSIREDEKFLTSVAELVKQCRGRYDIDVLIKKWKTLPKAQEEIAKYFLAGEYDYLLFLDDDHSGHCVEMIDALVGANTYMATMKTYSRHYPYPVALWDWREGHSTDGKCFVSIEDTAEVKNVPVDMTGWPMTLLRRDIFDLLDEPFFQAKSYGGVDWATDRFFCERLRALGVKPVGVTSHCLAHGKVNKDNVMMLRMKECVSEKQRVMLMAHEIRQKSVK